MRFSLSIVTRRILLLSLVLGVVLVAAPSAQAAPADLLESGITGTVVQRTQCVGGTCYEPARALVTATSLGAVPATFTAKSDAQGSFVLKLAPGLYRVSAASLGVISRKSEPTTVRVYAGFLFAIRIVLPADGA